MNVINGQYTDKFDLDVRPENKYSLDSRYGDNRNQNSDGFLYHFICTSCGMSNPSTCIDEPVCDRCYYRTLNNYIPYKKKKNEKARYVWESKFE